LTVTEAIWKGQPFIGGFLTPRLLRDWLIVFEQVGAR
jgi:hypothetical protein